MGPLMFVKLWLAIKPVKRIKIALNKRRVKKGKAPLDTEVNDEMLQAFKSKTIWLGILTSGWGAVQVFIQAGDFSREAIVNMMLGVAIIVLRAVTTVPLSQK